MENENITNAAAETTPEIDYKAEYEKLLTEKGKIKDAMDKACSEAANFKKQLREKQTEAERAEAERAEKDAALQAELEGYRVQNRISTYTSKLMESGYDAVTAQNMAKALPDGIGEEFFANQKAFLEGQKKSVEAQLLKTQPGLTVGNSPTSDNIESKELEAFRRGAGLI